MGSAVLIEYFEWTHYNHPKLQKGKFFWMKKSYFLESRMINPEDISYISEIVFDFIKKLPDQIII